MSRYLSTQYPNNKPAHQRGSKKGNKRKGDNSKSEDNNSNTGGTASAHVEDTATPEDSTAPNGGASIVAHVLEINQESYRPSRTIDDILGAHPMDGDDFWGNTNPGDVSIDTANSEEMMARSHMTEQHTCEYQGPDRPELLHVASKEPKSHNSSHNYQLDSSKKSKYSNILSNGISTNEITNNVTNTTDIKVLDQENQKLQSKRSTIHCFVNTIMV